MSRKLFTTLIDAVQAHAVADEDTGCWNWNGATQSGSRDPVPVIRWGRKVNAVRRLLALELFGKSHAWHLSGRKYVATYGCGNPNCVQPEHVVVQLRQTVQRRSALAARQNPMRGYRQATKARATHAVLDADKAAQIRLDPRAQKAIAADYGVSQATVSSIKRGRTWREYTDNPFKGLMT